MIGESDNMISEKPDSEFVKPELFSMTKSVKDDTNRKVLEDKDDTKRGKEETKKESYSAQQKSYNMPT